ncbi:ATP-dependent RNA helicase DRS1 [Striga asiatica]|uniref:ATP-dependent RNA helicase DRS1 n=1 Tax=Striga asiatica TaxID=4170 RepID=A0A5A7PQD8_STRAF|nr:ATP-dependent RNA helicase DRS1 [Striga asiatica]
MTKISEKNTKRFALKVGFGVDVGNQQQPQQLQTLPIITTIKGQKLIHHVAINGPIFGLLLLPHMLINYGVDKPIERGPGPNEPPVQTLRVDPPQTRHKIRYIKSPKQFRKLLQNLDKLLLALP